MNHASRGGLEIATLPPDLVTVDIHRARRIRLVALVLLCALVLAGLGGFLGVHTATTSISANGYDVQVDHPQIVRGGQAIFPEPVMQISTPPYFLFTFQAPPTGTLEVFFAVTKTPVLSDIGVQHAEIVLLADKPIVRASYRTWVVV